MDKGHCDQDRTHLANITARYQTTAIRQLGRCGFSLNWRVTGIYTGAVGQVVNITTGDDNALNGSCSSGRTRSLR
jgi:hypothetical protein